MRVFPAQNTKTHSLNAVFPGRLGLLYEPSRWHDPRGLPFALDNGRFATWRTGRDWSEDGFLKLLDKGQAAGDPLWSVVPDVPADADATFRAWELWAPQLAERGLTLALAVQDGMTPAAVRRHAEPSVIFVGGTRRWKVRTLWNWCREFERVHVGRINSERDLWRCHLAGAESCDGTGWFRGRSTQLAGLVRYLQRSTEEMGPLQLELEFSAMF